MSKISNFVKNNAMYGIHFNEPVNAERDGATNYHKIVQNPIDLGTITNRLYLDYYRTNTAFWQDLGQVWKNAKLYYKNPDSDVRVVAETLKQCCVELYK